MTGATIGKIGRIESGEAYINQRVLLFRNKEDTINKDFLYYTLQQHEFEQYVLRHIDSESAQPNISAGTIGKYQFRLPCMDSQMKIGRFLRMFDEKIELNQKINCNLYAQARAIFNERFVGIDALPPGWKIGNLLNIADYLNGLAMQRYRSNEGESGIPVLKIKELRQGLCDSSSELCSPTIKPEYIIRDGDVIFSWSGSLLVDFWCGGTCGLNQHLFKVTSERYDKWFFYLWTVHHLDRFIAIAADKATTMGHIKREELAKAEVVIPSDSDYKEISAIIGPIIDLIIANRIENRKLSQLRDGLLPKLMSGEIDVQEVC